MTGAETGGLLDNRRLMGFAFLAPTVVYVLTRGGPINHTLTLPMYSFLVGIDGVNLSQGTGCIPSVW